MKLIVAILLIGYAVAQLDTPLQSYCLSNNGIVTACTGCYNWNGTNNIGAREGVTTCTAQITNEVTNCARYNPVITSTQTYLDCGQCESGNWLNVANTVASVACASSPTSNAAADAACTTAAIANCDRRACFFEGAVYKKECHWCSSGQKGGAVPTTVGSASCTGMTIVGCLISLPTDVDKCYLCDTGTAVNQDELTCPTFTAVTNCRRKFATGTICMDCKNQYFHSGTKCVLGYAANATGPLTPSTNYCMGNMDNALTCSACYNYALGSIGARHLVQNSCTQPVANVVQDCLWYSGIINETRVATDCGKCNSKLWMNVSDPLTIHCSDTALDTGCDVAVPNCDQSYCQESPANTWTKGCRLCASGYSGASAATSVGFPTCSTSTTITNCSYYNPILITQCYLCSSGNALKSEQTLCQTFATDSNCRQLNETNEWCRECKNNYYFATTTCTLGYDASASSSTTSATTTTTCGANLMTASAFIMALLVFFNQEAQRNDGTFKLNYESC